jgi:hypothetical protein
MPKKEVEYGVFQLDDITFLPGKEHFSNEFEINLKCDTSVIEDEMLKKFIEEVINPHISIQIRKRKDCYAILDSADIFDGKTHEFDGNDFWRWNGLEFINIGFVSETNDPQIEPEYDI